MTNILTPGSEHRVAGSAGGEMIAEGFESATQEQLYPDAPSVHASRSIGSRTMHIEQCVTRVYRETCVSD